MIIENGILVSVDDDEIINGTFEIPASVTQIGKDAFSFCLNLTSIEIPEGVTKIEKSAFSNCENLTSVKIPKSVMEIGKDAFAYCNNLESIEILKGVTKIGDSAFAYCRNLKSIEIPESVTRIGNCAFKECNNLTSIEIPEGVKEIGDDAFYNCSNLKNIEIPEGVTEISKGVFTGCSNLTSIKIPEGVNKIGKWAFIDCSNLTSIEISEGLKEIEEGTFYKCSSLTSIEIPEGVTKLGRKAFEGCSNLTSVKIPESVTRIGDCAFEGCNNLTSIEIPESVMEIGYGVFRECSKLAKIQVVNGNGYYSDVNGVLYTKDKSVLKKYPSAKDEKMYIVLNGVNEIDDSAFACCDNLTSIKIPEGVNKIGKWAFIDCSNLTSIEISEGLKEIEEGTFYKCSSLTSIEIPEGVTKLGRKAFEGCSNLTSVKIPEGVNKIGKWAFSNCSNLTSIEISEGLKEIEGGAFYKCSSLTSIEIPEGVTEIGENAFYGCSNLISVELPNSVTQIGGLAFKGCSNLTSIKISKSLTTIGRDVFKDCYNLSEIIIPLESTESFKLDLYQNVGLSNKLARSVLFLGEDVEAIERIHLKSNFANCEDYDEKQMYIFYYKMLKSIGVEEIERMVELPNLTEEEIKKYSLEKDEAFKQMYNTQYKITGDLGIALKFFKQLSKIEKISQEKNSAEIRIFKSLNQKLEQGYEGSLTELLSIIIQEEQIEVNEDFIQNIKELEKSANKGLIKENFEKIASQIEQALSQPNEQYENPIVQMQIEPIKVMIQDVIIDYFKENGKIDLETLKNKLEQKIGNANAPYIIEKKEQIVQCVLSVLEKEENLEIINYSCLEALKSTKKAIGGTWKYKINQALKQLGYTFDNLPETLEQEEINKLSQFLGNGQHFEIQTSPRAVPKQGIEREKAYELLRQKGLQEIITYKQIHDMFGSVHEPYSEKFKEFFKKHRKEFLQNPEYYDRFGQIHNNFEMIINSPQLKNTYQKGELTIDAILGYLGEVTFSNQRPGDEELAKLSKSVGKITTEKEFEHVQRIFDITKMRERTTVPPMIVTKSKYRGRMLSPDDVLNLFAGNITTCCQAFNDVGEGSMALGSIEENAGIFVIEELDENGNVKNIVGQSLTIRQKGAEGAYDRLTFDNVEINKDALKNMSLQDQAQILEIYQEAGKQAIEKDKKFLGKLLKQGIIIQQQYDSLVLKEVIAGTGYNDLEGLKELPEAQIVVPDEAYFKYRKINSSREHPWIDSAGGKAPNGSPGTPVILATMDKNEIGQILQRNNGKLEQTVKTSDVPLWYGRIGKVQDISRENCQEKHIKQIRQIERIAYRDEQQVMNENDVESIDDIEYEYGIENVQIKLGSNNDWYLIYGDYDGKNLMISDLAIVGALNAEKKVEGTDVGIKNNSKLAIAEASNELYALLIDASKQDKKIYCNATSDTSLVNITRALRKGLIQLKTMEGQDIQYVKGKGLVYAENGELVQTRNWNQDEKIQMLDLQIIPNQEKLIEEKKKLQELLNRTQDMIRMRGTEKEKGLNEMRRQIREEKSTNDGR